MFYLIAIFILYHIWSSIFLQHFIKFVIIHRKTIVISLTWYFIIKNFDKIPAVIFIVWLCMNCEQTRWYISSKFISFYRRISGNLNIIFQYIICYLIFIRVIQVHSVEKLSSLINSLYIKLIVVSWLHWLKFLFWRIGFCNI